MNTHPHTLMHRHVTYIYTHTHAQTCTHTCIHTRIDARPQPPGCNRFPSCFLLHPSCFFSVQQQKLGFETCLSLIASRVAQTLPADTVSTPVQTFTSPSYLLQTHPAYPASLWALTSAEPCCGPHAEHCVT